MPWFTRRGPSAPAPVADPGTAAQRRDPADAGAVDRHAGGAGSDPADRSSRRSFLRTSGGVATVVAVPTAAAAMASPADATTARPANGARLANPTTPVPDTPVMAYVHDRKAGTVVIMTGGTERTVKDRELVKRLTVVPPVKKKKRPAKRRRTTPTAPRRTTKG
jgi:hypothetical protein